MNHADERLRSSNLYREIMRHLGQSDIPISLLFAFCACRSTLKLPKLFFII